MIINNLKYVALLSVLLLGACTDKQSQREAISARDLAYQKRATTQEPLLINCTLPCDQVAQLVLTNGGIVKLRYQNINALAVVLPATGRKVVERQIGVNAISKDSKVNISPPTKDKIFDVHLYQTVINKLTPSFIKNPAIKAKSLAGVELNAIIGQLPQNLAFGNQFSGATAAHANGNLGEGVIVAVIDTGTANNKSIVPALADSVIGGESFVESNPAATPPEPGPTSTKNDPHGTWVASIIAGHASFTLPNTDRLVKTVQRYAPESLIASPAPADESTLVMTGIAPGAKIYALKTFPADGGGASRSWVIAAMDRALTLKRNFNLGNSSAPTKGTGTEDDPYQYDALDIKVVNLSLGGPTLFPGGDIEDVLTEKMLNAGMVVVVAAGNEGFGALTVGGPATGYGAISVGASSSATSERILREYRYLGIPPPPLPVAVGGGIQPLTHITDYGLKYRPSDPLQVANFSSRGPNADGTSGIDILANGIGNFVQGADGELALISGTSFSSPAVAGAAALLWKAAPVNMTATQIRAVLIGGGNNTSATFGHPTTVNDIGHGLLDIPKSLSLLTNPPTITPLPTVNVTRLASVSDNLLKGNINVLNFGEQPMISTISLVPGQVSQYIFNVTPSIGEVKVELNNLSFDSPTPNAIFGEDVIFTVLDAPSAINDELAYAFVTTQREYIFTKLQPGLMRIAIQGDWTNAGNANLTLKVTGKKADKELPDPVFTGKIRDNESDETLLRVKRGTKEIHFNLSWFGDWSRYPAHDIDLILVDPKGNLVLDGATISSPELVSIPNPLPGLWSIFIDGFEIHGLEDKYALRAYTNEGENLKTVQMPK